MTTHDGAGFFLWWGLCVSALGLFSIILLPKHRHLALRAGLCTAPFGLLEFMFVPEYWNPPHLFGKWLSIEAIAFAFGSGIFAWLAAAIPLGARIRCNFNSARFWSRYAEVSLFLLAGIGVTWRGAPGLIGLSAGESSLIALGFVGAILLWRRSDFWPLACLGSLGFAVPYALQLVALGHLAPDAVLFWSVDVREGFFLFGFPIEEMMWAALFGAVCPLANAYVNEVRLVTGTELPDSFLERSPGM
jgi:hypothetical protein